MKNITALEELTRGYYVQEVVVDPSAASFIETIRRHGRYMVRAAANDVLDGIRMQQLAASRAKVQIHESCTDALREVYKPTAGTTRPRRMPYPETTPTTPGQYSVIFVIHCWPANTAGRIGGSEDVPKAFALAACPDRRCLAICGANDIILSGQMENAFALWAQMYETGGPWCTAKNDLHSLRIAASVARVCPAGYDGAESQPVRLFAGGLSGRTAGAFSGQAAQLHRDCLRFGRGSVQVLCFR